MNDPRGPHAIDPHGRGNAPAVCETLRSRYASIRAQSLNLAKPLSEEDCCVQSMPEASPLKWHLAHTTWFFETFILEKYEEGFRPFLLSLNPLQPAYREQEEEGSPAVAGIEWLACDGGLVEIGHGGDGFCFDNESPRHRQYLNAYSLASRLVTNGEYLDFIADGGYHDPRLWLSDGWDWVQANKIAHPIYWEREDDRWDEFTLGGKRTLDPGAPAVHLSYFEADAYARWAGARLPGEAEWEHAARAHEGTDAADRQDRLHPHPAKHAAGLQQMFGNAWQWTQTSYAPYPGYQWPQGAIGEYNGKFMVNQYVLRGSSCVTPREHSRVTYRNFFPATARWQFSGIRLAKDGSGVV